jgi:hypothetical protein
MSESLDRLRRALNLSADGNRMMCDGHGWVFLELVTERGRIRRIGQVFSESGKAIYEKKVTDSYYFKKWQGWGVNGLVLRAVKTEDGILRLLNVDTRERLWLPAAEAEEKGNWKWYKGKDEFERQVIIADALWVREPFK